MEDRRHSRFVNARYQIPIILAAVAVGTFIAVLSAFLALAAKLLLFSAHVGPEYHQMFIRMGVVAGIVVLVMAYVAVWFSHRFAGPAPRVKAMLMEVKRVARPTITELRVRRTDANGWLYKILNGALQNRHLRHDVFPTFLRRSIGEPALAIADRLGERDAEEVRSAVASVMDEGAFHREVQEEMDRLEREAGEGER
jgi:hypothetical protein